jgi:hypothetical protein
MSQNTSDKLKPKTRITSTNIEELIENYIKTGQLNLYDYVIFVHPKKTNNKEIITTFARVLFNAVLPEDYPFINETVTGKKFEQILKDIEQRYGLDTANEVIKRAQKYFLYLSSLTTPTFDVSKLEIPEEILKKRDEIVSQIDNMSPVEFDQKVYELYKELEKFLEEKGITFFDLVKSGTKGKASDLIQLFLVWGYGIDADGNLTPPVKHSLFEGMQPEELYYGSNKARFAGYLKSVGSGEPGYLAVKLRYALNDLYVSKKTSDCGTDKYLELTITKDLAKIILGRYYLNEKTGKLELIDQNNVDQLIGKRIKLRSPIYCKADDGVCVTCAGKQIERTGVDGHLGSRVTGSLYTRILNIFMKLSHQKISAGEDLDFREEFKKFYS